MQFCKISKQAQNNFGVRGEMSGVKSITGGIGKSFGDNESNL